MSHIILYFCETFRDIITEIFYKHDRKKNAFFLAFGHTFMIMKPNVEKKIFFLKFFFSCTPPLRLKKKFLKKIFFSTFGSVIINVWPKAKKKCVFFSTMFIKNFGNDVAKCLTKIVYYMRHFASLLRKFFHVNGQKKNAFFFAFVHTFCFIRSDLRK